MPPVPRYRQPIMNAAVALFRRQGFARTGLTDIVDVSGHPRARCITIFRSENPRSPWRRSRRRAGDWLRPSKSWHRSAVQPANCCALMPACWRDGCRNRDFATAAPSRPCCWNSRRTSARSPKPEARPMRRGCRSCAGSWQRMDSAGRAPTLLPSSVPPRFRAR